MYEINCEEMGRRIFEKRRKRKLTQEKMAEKVGIGPSHFGQIERGDNKCSLRVMTNIAIELETSLDTLVRGVDEYNANTALTEILKKVPKEKRPIFVKMCDTLSEMFQ